MGDGKALPPEVPAAGPVALFVVGTVGTPAPKDQVWAALDFIKPVERANNEWGAFTLSDFLLESAKGQFEQGYTNSPAN